ncbi:MAG: hypothetical protein QW423_00135 [Candidatus Aenigmatarchaeota archaeon]
MAISHVDFAIAAGIFFVFIGILFGYVISYLINYRGIAENSEVRSIASDLFNIFFTDEGVPSNWEESNLAPVKIGLMGKLYMMVINVTETNGSYRNNITINGSVEFDSSCVRGITNSSVRLYNSNNSQIPFQLYNQSFCEGFLKKGEIAFNLSLEPYQSEFFFLYFSSEKNILPPNYSVEFPVNASNYTFQTYPIQEFQIISVDKLLALRNLSYIGAIQTIPKGYEFKVEIS